MRSMAFALFERARLLLGHHTVVNIDDAAGFAFAADRPVDPPRFAPRLSATHGGLTTGDPGVSPDRTHTGWLP